MHNVAIKEGEWMSYVCWNMGYDDWDGFVGVETHHMGHLFPFTLCMWGVHLFFNPWFLIPIYHHHLFNPLF